jgi:hypothetical protein
MHEEDTSGRILHYQCGNRVNIRVRIARVWLLLYSANLMEKIIFKGRQSEMRDSKTKYWTAIRLTCDSNLRPDFVVMENLALSFSYLSINWENLAKIVPCHLHYAPISSVIWGDGDQCSSNL